MEDFPDFYSILGCPRSANEEQIRTAYKKAALSCHPDRFTDANERQRATRDFQKVAQAYHVLSDSHRKSEYDRSLNEHDRRRRGKKGTSAPAWSSDDEDSESFEFAEGQFENEFEDLLREHTPANQQGGGHFWSLVGGVSGAALGFIVANIAGAVAGGVAGNRLGALRDSHGKPVYEVFKELPQADKARILTDLASKFFAQIST